MDSHSGAAAATGGAETTAPRRAQFPRLRVLAIAISAGLVLTFAGSLCALAVALHGRSLSDAEQVTAHRDRGAEVVVFPAVLNRVTARVMFPMTRAVHDRAGALVAVVSIGLPSGSLIGAPALPRYRNGVVLTLLTQDAHLMAHGDFRPDLLGHSFPTAGMMDNSRSSLPARALDGRMAVQATQIDPADGFIANATIPITDGMAPLVWVAAIGLPLVLGLVWGMVWLTRSLARKQREAQQSSARLNAVLAASHLGSWQVTMPDGRCETNDRWAEMLGHQPEEVHFTATEWRQRLHPDDRERVMAELGRALSGQSPFFHVEHRMRHKAGHWVWVLDSGCVMDRGADGSPHVVTGTLLDISERREAEQRIGVLMRELDHRAKNLLAVVYSIINLMHGKDVAEFKAAILGRVLALGHVHNLLSESSWQGVDIGLLIRTETAAYPSDRRPRILASGPAARLHSAAAQALAMAVHELMTNSARYGALSDPGGEVHLTWSFAEDGMLRLVWQDQGGPPVVVPDRVGFGTTLLTTMVRNQLDGEITAEWHADGARFVLTLPPQTLCPGDTPDPPTADVAPEEA